MAFISLEGKASNSHVSPFCTSLDTVDGLAIITSAAGVAALSLSALHFYGSLIVLGIGWNFVSIGGTAKLDAALLQSEKAAVQGANGTNRVNGTQSAARLSFSLLHNARQPGETARDQLI